MHAKNSKSLITAVVILLVLFNGFTLLWLVLGWSPVLGNLVSAAQLRAYAAQVYPDLSPEGPWAKYDPVSSGYFLDFTLKDGGGRRSLGYDLKSGLVEDERRETVLREELGIAETPEVNGHMAFWWAKWTPGSPEEPVVGIRIDFRDRNDAPVPDEAAMREAMADQAMELYEDLSPRTPVQSVSVHYHHEAQEDRRGAPLWHSITVALPEDQPLTRELVLDGTLSRS